MKYALLKYTLLIVALFSLAGCDSRFASYDPVHIRITSQNAVEPMECPSMDITPVGKVYEGCAVESNRFQSMVHPEKAYTEAVFLEKQQSEKQQP